MIRIFLLVADFVDNDALFAVFKGRNSSEIISSVKRSMRHHMQSGASFDSVRYIEHEEFIVIIRYFLGEDGVLGEGVRTLQGAQFLSRLLGLAAVGAFPHMRGSSLRGRICSELRWNQDEVRSAEECVQGLYTAQGL